MTLGRSDGYTTTDAPRRRQRVIGALVGVVVGDALIAPFEPANVDRLSSLYPMPAYGSRTELHGADGTDPGRWTSRTTLTLLTALSIVSCREVNAADLQRRTREWLASESSSIRPASTSRLPAIEGRTWEGLITNVTPVAIQASRDDDQTLYAGLRTASSIVNRDPLSCEAAVIYGVLLAKALNGLHPLDQWPLALRSIAPSRRGYWTDILNPDRPCERGALPTNRSAAVLRESIRMLNRASGLEDSLREVVDVCAKTIPETALAVGGLLGAVCGIQDIPSRWTSAVHGDLPEDPPSACGLDRLQGLAVWLGGGGPPTNLSLTSPGVDPAEVLPGIWLSDFHGALSAPHDTLVISLCRTFGQIDRGHHRQVYLTDDDANLSLEIVVSDVLATVEAARAEARPVLVHCYGGASRTGLILRTWLRRTYGLTPQQATALAKDLWPHTATWNRSFEVVLGHDQWDRLGRCAVVLRAREEPGEGEHPEPPGPARP